MTQDQSQAQDPNAVPAPVSPQPSADDPNRREQVKAQLQEKLEGLKTELAQRLDQFLDEVGAII